MGADMQKKPLRRQSAPRLRLPWTAVAALIALAMTPSAHASLFSGETLDAVANGAAWVVLFIAPLAAIGIFLIIHILPEKIAEKKKHPQLNAIKTLCLLSLFFGGMLWPLAWLWAYTKPVIHKMAYGTDTDDSHGHEGSALSPLDDATADKPSKES
jgi:CBS domain containing-hemolysin-like protein